MEWRQGQHICVVGSNGTGKTFLMSKILDLRGYVLLLRTKADDVRFPGFKTIRSIDRITANQHHYFLAPKYEDQAWEAHRAMEYVWKTGGWCFAVDELFYLCDHLKREADINKLLTQGRSLNISVVCGMQRPSRITRFALSEAVHVFSFRTEGRDTKILAEATTPRLIPVLERLERYQFAYFNRITREIKVARAQSVGRL